MEQKRSKLDNASSETIRENQPKSNKRIRNAILEEGRDTKMGKTRTLPPVWMEAVGEWMNIKKRVQMTEVYEYPIISSEFEREGMRMTKNMERLIDMGMKKIKDLVIERSKEKIEEKIKRIGDRNDRNSLWKTYQKTKEKVEKRVQEEMKKPYGKTIESIEIWTNKGWRIARKITKTEKKRGPKHGRTKN